MTQPTPNPLVTADGEAMVIGILLTNPHLMKQTRLRSQDFHFPVHASTFQAMRDMLDKGEEFDALMFIESRPEQDQLHLMQCFKNSLSAMNFRAYEDAVRKYALRREVASVGEEVYQIAVNGEDIAAQIAAAQHRLSSVSTLSASSEVADADDAMRELIDHLESVYGKTGLLGVGTGFRDIDHRFRGFRPGDLVLVAARPSMGKSTYAVNIAMHNAMTQQSRTAFFSLEMSRQQLMSKIMSAESGIPLRAMMDGSCIDDDRFSRTLAKLNKLPLFIDDCASLSIEHLTAKARKLHSREKLGLIVVDYIQLMHSERRLGNRVDELTAISKGLKGLAKELGIPVVALAQLNRGVEQRADKRPMMSDLRESGSLEQDADIIQMLYRDDYYDTKSMNPGVTEVLTRKYRMGEVGTDYLEFRGSESKFVDLPEGFVPRESEPDQPRKQRVLEVWGGGAV